ncbi:MAG: SpoIIE family protein phosphatase [Bacillota bacterium]
MVICLGVAKLPRFGFSVSGDVVETVERSKGGISAVLADGQGNGPAARKVAAMVATRAVGLISEGARDGAVARAVHDILFAAKEGKVSCELIIVSADLSTRTVVVSRNSEVPVFVGCCGDSQRFSVVSGNSGPIGTAAGRRPQITEFPIEPGLVVVAVSDGVSNAGLAFGNKLDERDVMEAIYGGNPAQPLQLAEELLQVAVKLDAGRPRDDMSVVVLGISPEEDTHSVRRLAMRVPV